MSRQTLEDPVSAGNDALAAGDWALARERFDAALEHGDAPEAWEGLGWAGWWLSDEELTLRARERAYRGYRARGEPRPASRAAVWLAADMREFRGDLPAARGWLERARRLLEEVPECEEHGWLALVEADIALNTGGELLEVERLSGWAAGVGRAHGVPDLEAVGLAQEGIALVIRGRVEEGMRRLDEAAATAAGEDLHLPMSFAWAHCCLISACEGVGDFTRAARWCEAVRAFCEVWGGRQLLGICRSAYGRVLATSGDWAAADAELTAAVDDIERSRPGLSASGLVRLADLRVRQGRTEEARALFERAGPAGLVGLGWIALAEGDAAAAADAADRVLRHVPDHALLDRLEPHELLVPALAGLGRLEEAAKACTEVERTAETMGTPYLRGRARQAAGNLASARGEHDDARRAFEDAVDCFEEGAAPFEAATARLGLSRALSALGRGERAAVEEDAARAQLSSLGVRPEPPASGGAAARTGDLTARELEVLRLVAAGLGDAEIAERLVVSPHTVHRHVANVRAKLGLPSRAAAVAYAARAGLL